MKTHQKLLLLAVALSVLLPLIPVASWVLLPMLYLNTHLHELFHALAALATGGTAHHIRVFADGSGVTPVSGGSLLVLTAAGYVGASLIGAWMIYAGRTAVTARRVLGIVGVLMAISMLMFVRGDAVGFLTGAVWTVALLVGAKALQGNNAIFAAQLLGVQQCLNSVYALGALLHLSRGGFATDAQLMADATSVPAIVWAILWTGFSLVVMALALKAAWKKSPQASVVG